MSDLEHYRFQAAVLRGMRLLIPQVGTEREVWHRDADRLEAETEKKIAEFYPPPDHAKLARKIKASDDTPVE